MAVTIRLYSKYIYGKGLIALVTPSARYCYHFVDTFRHTIALTDMSGNVVNSYAYEPFGQILAEQEAIPQPFKFVGQYGVMAESSGLYYMRARYYDPSVGRFISEDPLGFGGGDVNLVGYVGNNPLNRIDPLGLTQRDIDVAIALARSTQTDLTFPSDDQYHVVPATELGISPATGKAPSAYTDPTGTYLNADKYLPKLNDKQATALLDTIIHEGVHWWLPWGDERQEDSCGKGYPYDDAKHRMTKELIKKYLKMRK